MTDKPAPQPPAETPHSAVWISLLVVNGQVVHTETRPAEAPKPPKPKRSPTFGAPIIVSV